jgi:epoxyqueuosine reductase
VKRIGRDRFVRNVLIAAGNSGEASLVPACRTLLGDASPLVRGAAVWALSRLISRSAMLALEAEHLPAESDSDVLDEWQLATRGLVPSGATAGAAA